ncbi:hypothetical protein AAFF_G00417940 [Aldrovandia affinis]|uniref:SAM domain-containing protein n=1 Tax=Aldrovandia affinis TaxID=143900 RepID=A0AAD7SCJ5_9TELE|nr:hypothetical protein AAFF_G00417940 [Aldrovandia affinis]
MSPPLQFIAKLLGIVGIMSDASEMLAAALERMDGIIAGTKALEYSNSLFGFQSPTSPFMGGLHVLQHVEELRGALELLDPEEQEGLRFQIPESTAESLAEWLQGPPVVANGHIPASSIDQYQDRLLRLESDRESLVLQVSVLTDQVEVQGEKIKDLDLCLEEHREKLNATEDLLQQELLSRTSLETQKLELLAEVSSLKLELTGLVQEVNDLRKQVAEMENERLQYEDKMETTKEELAVLNKQLEKRGGEVTGLQDEGPIRGIALEGADSAESSEKDGEMERKVESLVTESEEKPMEQPLQESDPVSTPGSEDIPKSGPEKDPERETSDSSPDIPEAGRLDNVQGEVCEEIVVVDTPPPKSPTPTRPAEDGFGNKKVRSSFGRGFFKIRGGKRTASAPNLAEPERQGTAHLDLAGAPRPLPSNSAPSLPWKKRSFGIMKFFGRLKRSQSTSFTLDNEVTDMEFKRGGVRATAGPRLGWSRDLQGAKKWSREQVCDWLQELGLGVHVGVARQWVTSGQTLLQASQQDLDRELGIKHPLHRKKLQLALQALGSEEDDNKGSLDFSWVTRWLDDIGLPQYKTEFDEGRVDGRMLHYMTVDELLSLKVCSVLHHLSMKRAIQVLRLNDYQPNCLRRRPSEEGNVTPAEVSQWTNHRVMEWLRSVDLAEYAPNLRGSGVHGALMVLEPRFTVETLALLLNIPPNKTLLRRHLATHFHLLVGADAQRSKQMHLESLENTPLTATAKVKPRKLSFGSFGSLRRRKQEESEEYVCPMDIEMPEGISFQRGARSLDQHLYEEDLDQLQQMEDSEGTVRQIGALSEGINNLTSLLKKDEFFTETPTCSPNADPTGEDSSVCGHCQRSAVNESDSVNSTPHL